MIITEQQLTDFNFIKQHIVEIDWNYISEYKTLSEDFIREFKNKINWIFVSKYQKLSENFILVNIHLISSI